MENRAANEHERCLKVMNLQDATPRNPLSKGVAASVADELRREITSAKLLPGSPLRQEEIATRFQISQIPVREALRALAGEGLVALVPNRGAVVATLTMRSVAELIEYRVLLEGKLLEWALPHLMEKDFEALEEVLAHVHAAEGDAKDFPLVVQLHEAFHTALYRKADRPFFLESIAAVRANLNRYLIEAWKTHPLESRSGLSHKKLLDQCRLGDTAKAVSLLRDHIIETGRLILADIKAALD